jgi:prevent-host-death family protein
MERVPVSKFKATCLALLERVRRTGQPILVTRRRVPIAQVIPPPPGERPESWLGSLKGTGRITGDILSPALEENVWEALDSDRSRRGSCWTPTSSSGACSSQTGSAGTWRQP